MADDKGAAVIGVSLIVMRSAVSRPMIDLLLRPEAPVDRSLPSGLRNLS